MPALLEMLQDISPLFSQTGLILTAQQPLWITNDAFHREYTYEVSAWEHEIDVKGGYKTARFTLACDQDEIEDWLDRGLGRHIVCYDAALAVVWEGFVNSITGNLSSLSVTRGPLMNVATRVSVIYTPYVDITVDPPTTGTATVTPLADDTAAQARYGIIEEVVSGGTLIDDATVTNTVAENQAEEIRDAYLKEYAHPETAQTLNVGDVQATSLSLECLGYEAFLDQYVYNSTATSFVTIPAKLQAVLVADPNNIYSSDYSHISSDAAHLRIVQATDDTDRLARAVIDEMINQGDSSDNRCVFMIMNERKAYYKSIATEIEYYHRLSDRAQRVETASGVEVYPWNVRPDKLLMIPDFMVGRVPDATDPRLDPRVMYVENVKFSAPRKVALTGMRNTKVKQLIARYGGTG